MSFLAFSLQNVSTVTDEVEDCDTFIEELEGSKNCKNLLPIYWDTCLLSKRKTGSLTYQSEVFNIVIVFFSLLPKKHDNNWWILYVI